MVKLEDIKSTFRTENGDVLLSILVAAGFDWYVTIHEKGVKSRAQGVSKIDAKSIAKSMERVVNHRNGDLSIYSGDRVYKLWRV